MTRLTTMAVCLWLAVGSALGQQVMGGGGRGSAGNILYVDANRGPYRTFEAAHAAAHDGDTIELAAGDYTNQYQVVLKSVTVRGAGRMKTRIACSATNVFVMASNNITIADLTVDNLNSTNNANFLGRPIIFLYPCGNIHLKDMGTVAFADGLYFFTYVTNVVADNCKFYAAWDTMYGFTPGPTAGMTNASDVTYNNCQFVVNSGFRGGIYENRCIANWSGGVLTLNNCSFDVIGTNASATVAGIYQTPSIFTNGTIVVNNCKFNVSGAGSAYFGTICNYDVDFGTYGPTNGILVYGSHDLTKVVGPLTYNGLPVIGGDYTVSAAPGTNFLQNSIKGRFVVSSGQLAAVVTNMAVATNSIISCAITDLTAGTNRVWCQPGAGLIRFQMPVVGAVNTPISWKLETP